MPLFFLVQEFAHAVEIFIHGLSIENFAAALCAHQGAIPRPDVLAHFCKVSQRIPDLLFLSILFAHIHLDHFLGHILTLKGKAHREGIPCPDCLQSQNIFICIGQYIQRKLKRIIGDNFSTGHFPSTKGITELIRQIQLQNTVYCLFYHSHFGSLGRDLCILALQIHITIAVICTGMESNIQIHRNLLGGLCQIECQISMLSGQIRNNFRIILCKLPACILIAVKSIFRKRGVWGQNLTGTAGSAAFDSVMFQPTSLVCGVIGYISQYVILDILHRTLSLAVLRKTDDGHAVISCTNPLNIVEAAVIEENCCFSGNSRRCTEQFRVLHGSTDCRDILCCNLLFIGSNAYRIQGQTIRNRCTRHQFQCHRICC